MLKLYPFQKRPGQPTEQPHVFMQFWKKKNNIGLLVCSSGRQNAVNDIVFLKIIENFMQS